MKLFFIAFGIAFAAAALVGTHGLAYWDAADYVRLSLEGGSSGLLLGRPLFLIASRAVIAFVDPHHAEPVLRWFWTAVSATAAPLMMSFALALGLERRAAFLAGLCLALSPSFAHTSHQVLTDGPALAASLAALTLAARKRAIAAGILLSLAITLRETSAVHAIAIAILLRRRAVITIGLAAALTLFIVLIKPPPSLAHWGSAMGRSSQQHPLSLRDVAISIGWMFAVGPLPVVVAIAKVRTTPRVLYPALIATVLLVFYPDGSFSPRYMLATAPFLFIVAAPHLRFWPLLLVPIALTKLATRRTDAIAARGEEAMRTFASPPQNAIVVPGHYCAHVRLRLAIEKRSDVELICPGWDWPDDLPHALERGRPIVLDLRPDAWVGAREVAARDAVLAHAQRRGAVGPVATITP